MSRRNPILAALLLSIVGSPLFGAVRPPGDGIFEDRIRPREGAVIGIDAKRITQLSAEDTLRRHWEQKAFGEAPRVWLDSRSGLPALVTLSGIPWLGDAGKSVPGGELSLEALADRAHDFLIQHPDVLGRWGVQAVFDREGSGRRGAHAWQVRFRQVVDGVPVEGAWYDFHVSHGNLVAFGATRWAPVRIGAEPSLTADEARAKLDGYVRPTAQDGVTDVGAAELLLLPLAADPQATGAWAGARGAGYAHRLVWRFRFQDLHKIALWTGEVDAGSGAIVAFYDDAHYDRIKGHVNPISDDGVCATGGCPEPGYPMPFTNYTEDGGAVQYADQHGHYQCDAPGSTIETNLDGRYFRIDDQCGPISETAFCGDEIDLGVSEDINCGAAVGASPGNTDGARSAYYSLSAVNRKARFWISGNAWLDDTQVVCNTHVGGSCNASWNGSINMFSRSAFCGDTAQIQGIVTHEWGHGMDQNDGGGSDNPSEAYSDITAIFETRESCVGRGFSIGDTCSGYGDACLECTGLREMDWDARQSHAPATATGFLSAFCPSGSGPCGKEVHCESYLASEALFDLATRDLTAMGLDADTAWQLAERLWYQSRPGSGGDAYNCVGLVSDSCSVGSWYHQLRVQDDDDGNLNNGTPHAAAIFAAFDRHDIACGEAGDPENQNTTSCPALAAPVPGFTAQSNAVSLFWNPVPDAGAYRVYRNEIGCSRGQFPVAETDSAATQYLDSGLANGLSVYYRVQAIGTNAACESPVSACIEASAQQLAGRVRFDQPAYDCTDEVVLEVTDVNHPSSSMMVTVQSDVEAMPETVLLSETSVGSARYTGSISTTTAPAAADGLLSVEDLATITAEYIDLDDGEGGMDVTARSTANVDCADPDYLNITVSNVTDGTATIDWTTSKSTTGHVEWGTTPALGQIVPAVIPAAHHSVDIGPFTECSRVYFRVQSTDIVGHTAVADVEGEPFEFNAFTVQGIVYQDGFETDTGWTLEGDWEIAAPQGLGTLPGDPTAATEGLQVLGQDLTGRGSNPGDYEFNTTFSATSPVIDTSSLTSVELRLDRWLNYQASGNAVIEALDSGGFWREVWSHDGGLAESAWSVRAYDISSFAAGNANLRLRFRQVARFGIDAGWNVDRMQLRDSGQTTFGACGGCVGAPTFAGIVSVTDEACSTAGLNVAWSAAPAWGSGAAGTYTVYRDTEPGFTPGPENQIASGVVGTSWIDTTAPSGVSVHYLVRAENDETCASGPSNGGLTDINLVYADAVDLTGQPLAGEVGNTLIVDQAANHTDVSLDWTAVDGAASYRVYRSAAPDAGFVVAAQPGDPTFDDANALDDGLNWYYLVTAISPCGDESAD